MFRLDWLNNNLVVGTIFALLVVLNAVALMQGWYSG